MWFSRRELIDKVTDPARQELIAILLDYLFGDIDREFHSSEWMADDRYETKHNNITQGYTGKGEPHSIDAGVLGKFILHDSFRGSRKMSLVCRGLDATITLVERKHHWSTNSRYMIIWEPLIGPSTAGIVTLKDGKYGIFWFPPKEDE